MTKKKWKSIITSCCVDAGTYEPYYDQVIDTLADILSKRDAAEKIYKAGGSQPVIVHVN